MSQQDCLFCRIVHREIPADITAEADGLLAFNDINPQAPTHLLIVPTEHIPSLAEVTEAHTALVGNAVHFANRLARQHQLTDAGSGYRLVINCGPQAGQSVGHLHVHLLGGRALRWPPG